MLTEWRKRFLEKYDAYSMEWIRRSRFTFECVQGVFFPNKLNQMIDTLPIFDRMQNFCRTLSLYLCHYSVSQVTVQEIKHLIKYSIIPHKYQQELKYEVQKETPCTLCAKQFRRRLIKVPIKFSFDPHQSPFFYKTEARGLGMNFFARPIQLRLSTLFRERKRPGKLSPTKDESIRGRDWKKWKEGKVQPMIQTREFFSCPQ